jgi:hypothetical protein
VEEKEVKKQCIVLVALLLVSVAVGFINVPAVKASTTLTYSTSSSDGHIEKFDGDYYIAHHSVEGVVSDTASTIRVGQAKQGATYFVDRAFLFFDTSSLPNEATIDSAILSVYVTDDYSTTDFNVTIQTGDPTDPLTSYDYRYIYYSGAGGTRSTSDGLSEDAYWNITLSEDGEDWISLTSDTAFCLRSQEDIDYSEPSDSELIAFASSEAGASYTAKLYVTYTIPDLTLTLTSSPAVGAEVTINGTDYTTPSYASHTSGDTAHLTAESGVIDDGTGYMFDHWYINSTDTYYTQSIDLTITGDTTIQAYYVEIANVYYFYGPFDEETGYPIDENVTVGVFYDSSGYPYYTHEFNGSWVYTASPQALFFRFTFEDNSTREYWVDPSEDILPVYIFHGNVSGTQATYTVQFTDTTGVLNDYPFVTVERYVNGTLYTIEKRKIDSEKKILTNVIPYRTYTLSLGESTAYTFGELTFGSTATISLTITSLMFPETVIMGYRYVRCYANRDMESGTVYAYYQDLEDNTDNVTISIYFQTNGTLVTTSTQTDIDEWSYSTSALDNSTDYYLTMQVYHGDFGYLTYSQVLPRLYSNDPPWGIDVLGGDSLPFTVAYLIPTIAILAVASSFSAANTVVGLFATVVTAIIIAYIGWMPIAAEVLVFAFALVVIFAIATLRRRTYG